MDPQRQTLYPDQGIDGTSARLPESIRPTKDDRGPVTIRVALIDDNDRFRHQLAERLSFFDEIEIVAEADSSAALIEKLAKLELAPDVVLVDIELRDESGVDVAELLTARFAGIGVLMLTVFEDNDNIFRSVQAGAGGYLLKDTPVDELVAAIRELRDGGVPLSRGVARKILGFIGGPAAPLPDESADRPSPKSLTPRERELLDRIVRGETEARIAQYLGISTHTVRTHVKNIYQKLRVRSRAEAVSLAYERDLLRRRP